MLLDAKADVLVYEWEKPDDRIIAETGKGRVDRINWDIRGTATVISNHRLIEKRNGKTIVELPSNDMVSKRVPASNKAAPEALHAYAKRFICKWFTIIQQGKPYSFTVRLTESYGVILPRYQ